MPEKTYIVTIIIQEDAPREREIARAKLSGIPHSRMLEMPHTRDLMTAYEAANAIGAETKGANHGQ